MELEEVSRYVYVVVVCRVYVRGVSTRASAGATAMGRRRERRPHRKRASARSPAGHLRVEPLARSTSGFTPGNRLSLSIVRGDTTDRVTTRRRDPLRSRSVGILASQLLRHCATHTTSSCVSVRVRIWTAVHTRGRQPRSTYSCVSCAPDPCSVGSTKQTPAAGGGGPLFRGAKLFRKNKDPPWTAQSCLSEPRTERKRTPAPGPVAFV
jgi:hypothetical protein